MNRATGLLIIEVRDSNPNGNPDQESDPRLRPDDRGMISPVSFKRKLRDLAAEKEGQAWKQISQEFNPPLKAEDYQIFEKPGKMTEVKTLTDQVFKQSYWDGRIFGNTVLEKKADSKIPVRTGVVQFGVGVSVSPVLVDRMTTTVKAEVQEGKTRGMAPLAFRIVYHGVYVMPYFVNPVVANRSGCTSTDVDLMKRLIPLAYSLTASYVRSNVIIRHAWHMEHLSPLGSCPDYALIEAMTPKRRIAAETESPSKNWEDYDVPIQLPDRLGLRIKEFKDLANL